MNNYLNDYQITDIDVTRNTDSISDEADDAFNSVKSLGDRGIKNVVARLVENNLIDVATLINELVDCANYKASVHALRVRMISMFAPVLPPKKKEEEWEKERRLHLQYHIAKSGTHAGAPIHQKIINDLKKENFNAGYAQDVHGSAMRVNYKRGV